MHMADALVSAGVGGTMCAVSAVSVGFASHKLKAEAGGLTEKKIPVMAVMGAFVFASQMINFTIPGTGSSGHIGGGILLAAMLGGCPALLSVASVLIIQCLFFADGGLLALGCNIFNMGVIPCLIVYPLLFKPLTKHKLTAPVISVAAFICAVVSLQLGAFGVVLETQASGITALPFGIFALLMQPIHLAIGIVEGVVTAAVLCFVYKMRPDMLESAAGGTPIGNGVAVRKVLITFAVAAVVIGGGLSVIASTNPDGLEWAVERTVKLADPAGVAAVPDTPAVPAVPAVMPDYDYKSAAEAASKGENGSVTGTSVAGIVGGVLVFVLAGGTGLIISAVKKTRKKARND